LPDPRLPPDIRPEWLSVVRRLQSVATDHNQGLAVLSIHVLVDSTGRPQAWTEPACKLLEPKGRASKLLELLTE